MNSHLIRRTDVLVFVAACFLSLGCQSTPRSSGGGAGGAPESSAKSSSSSGQSDERSEIVAHPSQLRFGDLQFSPPARAKFRHELPGGVVAYVVEDPSLPLVDVSIQLRAGSYLDPAGREGLAATVGAILRTGGTESMSPAQFDEEIAFLAARISTSIGDTEGSASFNCLSKDVDRVLELFFEMLHKPRFDESRLEIHRRTTLQGLARRNDSTASIESREWQRLLRGAGHYSTDRRTGESIEAISRDDLVSFHRAHVHPRNFVLAISGDVKTADILAKIIRSLEGWPSPAVRTPPPPAPAGPASPGVYIVDKKDVNQGRVRIGHVGVHRDHPDYYALRIMNHVLGGGGFVSRIMSRVRSDEGLAYSARSLYGFGVWHPRDGEFRAYFQSKSPSVAQATAIVLEEIDRMRTEKISDDELGDAISYSVNVFPRFFAQAEQIAETFADDEFTGRADGFWSTYRQKIQAVSADDVLRAAKEHLRPDQLIFLVVGNREDILAGDPDKPTFSLLKIAGDRGVQGLPLVDPVTLKALESTPQ